MATFMSLEEAVESLVPDGTTVAMEGFSHLVPYAAARELIRQDVRALHLVRMVPDILADMMIGAETVDTLSFSWAGNPGLGLLPRFRDAVENHWPNMIQINEHTHAELANRFVAGASSMPFMAMRQTPENSLSRDGGIRDTIACPFTNETVSVVKAIAPDVTIVHAQSADHDGNIRISGVMGVQKEAIFAAKESIVTVEQVVDKLPESQPGITIPGWTVSAIAIVKRGAKPSYVFGKYNKDSKFLADWKHLAKDRTRFKSWLRELVDAEHNPGTNTETIEAKA